jgi:lipocalin
MATTNVADLVLDFHAGEMRGVADVLDRYKALVAKVADGGTLTEEEAVTAASCAFELKLPPDRFDRDVGTWRNIAAMDRQIADNDANKPTADDQRAEREKLAALEKAVNDQRLKMRRDISLGMARVVVQTQRREMAQANPHLYGSGVLSQNEWAAVRQ